ncbi:MAG: tRNA (guanosine(37)-N1)-methyltransferase TrmD [Clostridiales bacterium]|nr:tRNA (guanosine(37)-N1)-methyltransferase TrmD [Clostridiales bacterium]
MKITILTQFPEMFPGVLEASMLGRAQQGGLLEIKTVNIRDYTKDKHRRTDDAPFGGGAGMVMSPQPAFDALRACGAEGKRIIYMSPRGRLLDQELAQELAAEEEFFVLCGHYEGIDERIIEAWNMEEVSIGDYVLTGGELAAMVMIDCACRFVPGVLGSEVSLEEESIYSGLLEYPHYTKPRNFEGYEVPQVLVEGNHKLIRLWQFEQALRITARRRPDMLAAFLESPRKFSKDEKKIIDEILRETQGIEAEKQR